MTRPTLMQFGSLFTGIGGFDLGLERAGMECAWQVEIDPRCQELLRARWSGVEKHGDVRTVGAAELAGVDLICGGFPCQDLSVAGRRAGLAGKQSGLWFEFHRVLAEIRPSWCLIENVPGLLSSNGGRDFAIILQGLVELGYGVAWRILDAQYFGVAQRRRRVFIIGHLGDGRAAEVLFESESMSGNPPPRREAGEEVAGTFAGSSQAGGFRTTDLDNQGAYVFESRFARNDRGKPDVIVPPLKAQSGRSGKGDGAPLVLSVTERTREGGRNLEWQEDLAYALDNPGGGGRAQTRLVAAPLRSRQMSEGVSMPGRGGEDDENLVAYPAPSYAVQGDGTRFGSGRHNQDTFVVAFQGKASATNSMNPAPIAAALDVGKAGGMAVASGFGVRRLTPTECCRLQAFPDDWLDGLGLSDSVKYKMLGNAVCTNVAEWIGRRIVQALRTNGGLLGQRTLLDAGQRGGRFPVQTG